MLKMIFFFISFHFQSKGITIRPESQWQPSAIMGKWWEGCRE